MEVRGPRLEGRGWKVKDRKAGAEGLGRKEEGWKLKTGKGRPEVRQLRIELPISRYFP